MIWYLIVSIPDLCPLFYFGVVDSVFVVALIVCVDSVFWSLFCYTVLSVLSSFAIILMRKRVLFALL